MEPEIPQFDQPRRIALLLADFRAGGVQTSFLAIANELIRRGHEVDLVVGEGGGPLVPRVPNAAEVFELERAAVTTTAVWLLRADPAALMPFRLPRQAIKRYRQLPSFVRYLRTRRPNAVVAAEPRQNLMAIWANRLCPGAGQVVVTEHGGLHDVKTRGQALAKGFTPVLLGRAYSQATAVVAVSAGLAEDLAARFRVPRDRTVVIYNPVVDDRLLALSQEPVDHPWFQAGEPPVVLGVGRVHRQKDFATLIRAFAQVIRRRPARLVILGTIARSGSKSNYFDSLQRLAAELEVEADVAFMDFVDNPYRFMRAASVFVLSSAWEGFGNVLVEALACGCPVVSTDCRDGPDEILDGGRYGPLVPVGDDTALAAAIERSLDQPMARDLLQARGARLHGRARRRWLPRDPRRSKSFVERLPRGRGHVIIPIRPPNSAAPKARKS